MRGAHATCRTVSAADGSTLVYTVTVTVGLATSKSISAFSIISPVATGVITGTNIAVTLPYGSAVTALVSTFSTNGASVKVGTTLQTSGSSANNFTSPVTYTVTAADSTTQTYVVTVTVALNPAKAITAFVFSAPTAFSGSINSTTKNITATAPHGTALTALAPTITQSGASVSPASGVAQDFSSPVTYTVTAADGSIQPYTATVTASNWSTGTMPMSYGSLVAFGNGVFVAIQPNSPNAASSTDGIHWTARTMPTSAPWTAITYGGGLFVAVSGTTIVPGSNVAATSPDGITWTQRTLSTQYVWSSVAYGNGVFVAVSNAGQFSCSSPDGTTWTTHGLPVSESSWRVTYGGTSFVAIAYGTSVAATSTDGTTWTQRTLPVSDNWSAVTYGNSKFVAVSSYSSNSATSPDGINWTLQSMTASGGNSIAFGNGTFVVNTGTSSVATSSDGITWNTDSNPTISTSNWANAAYGNSLWVQVPSVGSLSLAATTP